MSKVGINNLVIGQKYGHLTYLGESIGIWRVTRNRYIALQRRGKFECECLRDNCRKTICAFVADVKFGKSKTCGRISKLKNLFESLSGHPYYKPCRRAIQRCHDINNEDYGGYGGRGICVYEPWRKDVGVFLKWIEENLGFKPSPNHSLDRINNNGNYEPGNLRWATKVEQSNNRRNSRRL